MAEEVAPGLWRWTAPHAAWRPGAEPGSAGDWDPDVGCVLAVDAARAVFVDPLLPADETAFWAWSDVAVGSRPVHVLTTIRFHGRSREEVAGRYGGEVVSSLRSLPPGVEAVRFRAADETMFWLRRAPARSFPATASSAPNPTECGCARTRGSGISRPRSPSPTCALSCVRCSTSRWSASSSPTARPCCQAVRPRLPRCCGASAASSDAAGRGGRALSSQQPLRRTTWLGFVRVTGISEPRMPKPADVARFCSPARCGGDQIGPVGARRGRAGLHHPPRIKTSQRNP